MSIFKNREPEFERMVFRDTNENIRVEISYNAGTEIGKGNPKKTDVFVRGINAYKNETIIWEHNLGNINMPTGAWHGLSLIIFNDKDVVLGCSNSIYCLNLSNGEIIWKKEFESSLITEISKSGDNEYIYVYFSMFDFSSDFGYGNIAKLSFQGDLLWNIEKPDNKSLYSNPIHCLEGSLVATTSDSHLCFIDEKTGKIEKKVFCKT